MLQKLINKLKKNKEKQHTDMFAEIRNKSQSGEPDIEKKQLEGTPFTIINVTNAQEWFLTYGPYRLTENFKSEINLHSYIANNSFNLAAKMAGIIAERTIHQFHQEMMEQAKNKNTIDDIERGPELRELPIRKTL